MQTPSRPSHGDVSQSESDTNRTDRRAAWQQRALDAPTRALLAKDERHFLRQSVSTPCLNAIAKAEGIWIEDVAGRRYMDFHGNNVHHIGYGHPRLKRAITEQMDALAFAPRRYANSVANALAAKLAAIAPGGLTKALFTTGGSDAVEVAVKLDQRVAVTHAQSPGGGSHRELIARRELLPEGWRKSERSVGCRGASSTRLAAARTGSCRPVRRAA